MRPNALLVRYEGGWIWVEDEDATGPRIEATLIIDHVQSEGEARRQAAAELARFSAGQTQITLDLDPIDGEKPLQDYGLGATVTIPNGDLRLMRLTVARDPARNGVPTYAAQFGDLIDSPERRQRRHNKNMGPGDLGGASRIAKPRLGRKKGIGQSIPSPDWAIIVDSQSDGAITAESDPIVLHKASTLTGLKITSTSTSADTDIAITVDGVLQETHTLGSGDTTYLSALTTALAITPDHTTIVGVDGDADRLVVQLIYNDGVNGSDPA